MRRMGGLVGLGALALALFASGCTVTPEQRAASARAWAARDQERRADCARQGLGFLDGACLSRGGP